MRYKYVYMTMTIKGRTVLPYREREALMRKELRREMYHDIKIMRGKGLTYKRIGEVLGGLTPGAISKFEKEFERTTMGHRK